MKKPALAALAAIIMAFPAAAHAHPDNARPQGADQAHDHSARASGAESTEPSAMRQRQMENGAPMENCRCPCCEMMKQHGGGKDKPSDGEAAEASPEPPQAHQH